MYGQTQHIISRLFITKTLVLNLFLEAGNILYLRHFISHGSKILFFMQKVEHFFYSILERDFVPDLHRAISIENQKKAAGIKLKKNPGNNRT